jgi:hypothetical protein
VKRHTTGEDDGRLARLAAQVDRLDQQLTGLAGLRADVDAHTSAITRLAETLGRSAKSRPGDQADAAAGGEASGVREWMTVTDPAAAVKWLDELAVWIRRVWTRYQRLAVCWVWHPVVVAELLAVQASWTAATGEDASADGLSAWHDRWQPGAATRVGRQLAGCERSDGLHLDGATKYRPDPAVLDEVAAWWATTHGADPDQPSPGLTPTTTTSSGAGLPFARARQETTR